MSNIVRLPMPDPGLQFWAVGFHVKLSPTHPNFSQKNAGRLWVFLFADSQAGANANSRDALADRAFKLIPSELYELPRAREVMFLKPQDCEVLANRDDEVAIAKRTGHGLIFVPYELGELAVLQPIVD